MHGAAPRGSDLGAAAFDVHNHTNGGSVREHKHTASNSSSRIGSDADEADAIGHGAVADALVVVVVWRHDPLRRMDHSGRGAGGGDAYYYYNYY